MRGSTLCFKIWAMMTRRRRSPSDIILARTHRLQQTRGGSDALLPWRFMTSSNAAAIENVVTALRYRWSISYDHDCIKLTSRWSQPSADRPRSRTTWYLLYDQCSLKTWLHVKSKVVAYKKVLGLQLLQNF